MHDSTKPKKIRRSISQWQALLNEFQTSDSTVLKFCQNNHITVSGFYLWRKKLSQEIDGDEPGESPHFVQIQGNSPRAEINTAAWDIELELGQSIVLRIRKPC